MTFSHRTDTDEIPFAADLFAFPVPHRARGRVCEVFPEDGGIKGERGVVRCTGIPPGFRAGGQGQTDREGQKQKKKSAHGISLCGSVGYIIHHI